jgi:hypothetical protein
LGCPESIVVDTNNTLFITNHYEGKIFRIGVDRVIATHAIISGKATGLALTPNGELLLSGWDEKETSVVWRIASDGTVELLTELPVKRLFQRLTLDNQGYERFQGA